MGFARKRVTMILTEHTRSHAHRQSEKTPSVCEGLGMCTMMLTAAIMRMLNDKDQPNQQPKGQMGSGVTQLSSLQQCKEMKPSSSCRRTGDSEYRSGERTREFKAPFWNALTQAK